MIIFINTFLSYVLLFIIFAAIMIAAIFCGKKLRDYKDKKNAEKDENASSGKVEE